MPDLLPWLAVILAAVAVLANDAPLQVLGTLIASRRDLPWWGLWAVAVVFNRACNPWLRLDFEADYTLLRYRPRGPLLNGVLAVAALGWNLAMLPWTLGAGWQARRRIDRCRAARRG